ncbi:hypothetical protein HK104_006910 [Borealophlyctis nickersoniae]|nr:hypothetical protein HK104_006910 [Borealophlyctis nickersoniae]
MSSPTLAPSTSLAAPSPSVSSISPSATSSPTPLPSPSPPPSPSPSLVINPGLGSNPIPLYYVPDPSISGALTWFVAAIAVTLVSVLLYEVMRKRMGWRKYLYARVETLRDETPDIPAGKFQWLTVAVTMPEKFYVDNIGLDAVMFLRFLRMSMILFSALCVVLLPILLPLNYRAHAADLTSKVNATGATYEIAETSLVQFSIANIPDGSSFFWAHTFCAYVVSCLVYYLLFTQYHDYTRLVTKYIHEETGVVATRVAPWRKFESLQLRTILVQNIPKELHGDQKLIDWFQSLGIGEVETAVMDRDAGQRLLQLTERRDRALRKLERAYVDWVINVDRERAKREGRKPRRWYGPGALVRLHSAQLDLGQGPLDDDAMRRLRPLRRNFTTLSADNTKVRKERDAIDHYAEKLAYLTVRIKQYRQLSAEPLLYRDPNSASETAAAFVTFRTQRAAQIAVQVLLHSHTQPWAMDVRLAPAPQDVIWKSVSMPFWRRKVQNWGIGILCVFLCFFWIVPTSLIATLTSVDSLAKVPAFRGVIELIHKSPQLYIWIKAIGPPLVLSIFNLIMPLILEWLSYQQAIESNSHVEIATMNKYFLFLFFNVFFVFTLADTIWKIIGSFFENPISIVTLVAGTLPQGSTFFISYIILQLISFPLELFRPGVLILMFFGRYLMKTPREFHELSMFTSYVDYGVLYPIHVIIFVIVICYSTMAPLVLLPGAVYFAMGWLVYRNQLLFVYVKEWESFGRHWVQAFKMSVAGVGVYQVTLLGILAAKGAQTAALLLIPLICFTPGFYIYCKRAFERRTYLIPLDQFTHSVGQKPSEDIRPSMGSASDKLSEYKRNSKNAIAPSSGSSVVGTSAVPPITGPAGRVSTSTQPPAITVTGVTEPADLTTTTEARKGSTTGTALLPLFEAAIVVSPEQHLLDRHPTSYLNPIFSRPLPRPWLPVSVASWWDRIPMFSSEVALAELPDGQGATSLGNSELSLEEIRVSGGGDDAPLRLKGDKGEGSNWGKKRQLGIRTAKARLKGHTVHGVLAVATVGAVALAVGAPDVVKGSASSSKKMMRFEGGTSSAEVSAIDANEEMEMEEVEVKSVQSRVASVQSRVASVEESLEARGVPRETIPFVSHPVEQGNGGGHDDDDENPMMGPSASTESMARLVGDGPEGNK